MMCSSTCWKGSSWSILMIFSFFQRQRRNTGSMSTTSAWAQSVCQKPGSVSSTPHLYLFSASLWSRLPGPWGTVYSPSGIVHNCSCSVAPRPSPAVCRRSRRIGCGSRCGFVPVELIGWEAAPLRLLHWLKGLAELFIVWTDHKNLAYFWGKPGKWLNSRQVRWAFFLGCFSFIFTYCPGTKNTKPNVFSHQLSTVHPDRDPEPILPPSCIMRRLLLARLSSGYHLWGSHTCPV